MNDDIEKKIKAQDKIHLEIDASDALTADQLRALYAEVQELRVYKQRFEFEWRTRYEPGIAMFKFDNFEQWCAHIDAKLSEK